MVRRTRSAGLTAGTILALFAGACGGGEDRPVPSPTASASAAPRADRDGRPQARAQKAEREPIDPARVGAVHGVATFAGEAPERQALSIAGTAGCHAEGHEPPLSERVIVTDGRLKNVFVHVTTGLEGWEFPGPPAAPLVLDQKGCMYAPHVAGIQIGQTLRVLNSDGAAHNVHARPRRNDSFNRSQAPGGVLEHVFEQREVMVPIVCDIHPWMKTFVGVVEHPFFAVSATDGSFAIEGLPPGTYTLSVWHEAYDSRKVEVTVEAGGTSTVELVFP